VADADQRELYISIGCALENLLIAAEHFGYGHQVTYFPEPAKEKLPVAVKFMPPGQSATTRDTALFDAIPARHTNRGTYEERPIPQEDLERLRDCCIEGNISLYTTGDLEIKRKIDELVTRGDAIQFSDPASAKNLASGSARVFLVLHGSWPRYNS